MSEAVSVIGLCNAIRSVSVRRAQATSTVSIARSCPVNCINMKCQCIIDETIATFTVCARVDRAYNACVRACVRD